MLPSPDTVTAQVSADCRTMSIQLDAVRSYSGIRFAVWSSAGGQDDLTWYTAKSAGGNRWTYNVALAKHNSTGTYFIHVYSGRTLVAHTTAQVKSLPPAAPGVKTGLTATVSSDNAAIELALTTAAKYGKVRFAVWSSAGGQDDLTWYKAENIGGAWVAAANLATHHSAGTYFIHVYAGNKLVAHTTVTVKSLPNG